MQEDQLLKLSAPSRTAESCAMIRAAHYLHGERPLIFEDPVAIELVGDQGREICLRSGEMAHNDAAGIVLGRARYAEDLLEAAVQSGIDQYVLLGAGLDTFGLRRPDLLRIVRVWEIDEPATQAWKRERLAELGREVPAALEFVAADFEQETIGKALGRSSYRSDRRAFFSWLGTLPYLSHDAIIRTLRSLAAVSVPGSELVFDYRVSNDFIDPQDIPLVQAGDQATLQGGERKRSFLSPVTFPTEVCALGFDLVESLSPGQMGDRYFAGRSDIRRVRSHMYYAHFRRR